MVLGMFKFWLIGLAGLVISYRMSALRTKASFARAKRMVRSMIFDIIGILMIIGVIMAAVPMETITRLLGGTGNLAVAVAASAAIGGITIIPAFIAFPLVKALGDQGAHILVTTAFLTTLTMVGVATLKIEIQEFGKRFALIRNGLSFVLAIVIAIVMGVIL